MRPPGLQPGHDDVPLVGEARKHAVAEAVLELVPEPFDRVQFRAVGGQPLDSNLMLMFTQETLNRLGFVRFI